MKMNKKLLLNVLSFVFVLCLSLGNMGCKFVKPITKEDLIPETLGVAEGLYLYYDNYRSLTDGTEKERLLNDIKVDDVTYTIDEYSIEQIEYMPSQKEIFYILKINNDGEEEKTCLWHYNYDTKENGLMCEFKSSFFMGVFKNYIFLRFIDCSYQNKGVLYDGNLNLLQDELETYSLRENLLYKYEKGRFYWWNNGFFSVQTNGNETILIEGKYVYLLSRDSVYAINLDTGNYLETNFGNEVYFLDSLSFYYNTETVDVGEKTFFITYTTTTISESLNEPLKTGCCLWELSDLKAECIYKFPEKYEILFSMNCNERYLNLRTCYIPMKLFNKDEKRKWGEAYYDLEKDTFVDNRIAEINENVKIFRVGEFEFYTDYSVDNWLFPEYYCCYLHRVKDNKDEILQYRFTNVYVDINTVFFNDIHLR